MIYQIDLFYNKFVHFYLEENIRNNYCTLCFYLMENGIRSVNKNLYCNTLSNRTLTNKLREKILWKMLCLRIYGFY